MIIGEMQSKQAMWSTADRERKFDRLLRLVADRTWLAEAARITLASSGARTPGVEGVDKVTMEGNLHHELETMRVELVADSYMPLPARRVYIPKANGKLRPLGIPRLRDRIVQRAMLMAMEPRELSAKNQILSADRAGRAQERDDQSQDIQGYPDECSRQLHHALIMPERERVCRFLTSRCPRRELLRTTGIAKR